jgi:hypothetical protein
LVRKREKFGVFEIASHRLCHLRDQAAAAEQKHAVDLRLFEAAAVDRVFQWAEDGAHLPVLVFSGKKKILVEKRLQDLFELPGRDPGGVQGDPAAFRVSLL